jgi:hypothetical protein
MQHLMSVGSSGQKSTRLVPPDSAHCADEMQVPGTPSIEHGPLGAAMVVLVRARAA